MLDYKELSKKETLLDNASEVLKREFVGLDDIIDGIIHNVKPWFLFPELQNRPHVVNLWGLTGVGKTSLVKRLVQLLQIERDMVYFNFAEIGECSSWEIENNIEEQLSSERSNRVFVYDEFQYAATLDKAGNEKDKKSGLKPFWELLDNGKLHKRDSFWHVRSLYKAVKYMERINEAAPIKLEDGAWVNANECLSHFTNYEIAKFAQVFNFSYNRNNGIVGDDCDQHTVNEELESGYDIDDDCNANACTQQTKCGVSGIVNEGKEDRFFLRDNYLETLIDLYDKTNSTISDRMESYRELCRMSYDEIINLMMSTFDNASKGYDLNFSDSIIFVIGNLDEAYEIAFNADPDMSPDQFNKITKNINIVDIKEALQKRFRNEQIARLGNIHMIYPSFSSASFKKIIRLSLDGYSNDVVKLCGYKVMFAENIVDFIYKESVFPTHGTRPVYSSIHEIVKSKLPFIVRNIYDNKLDADSIEYTYKGKRTIINIYDKNGSKLGTYKFKEKTRLDNLRESKGDEEQALVAVHESGHFAVYAALMHKIPEKLCSKTASNGTGGFLMQDYDDMKKIHSYEALVNQVKISLGGYVAEKMVFGDDMRSNGASSDLVKATTVASQIIRRYGMGKNIGVTTYLMGQDSTQDGNLIRDNNWESINAEIREILDKCESEVIDILNDSEWRKLFKASSEYLSDNSSMPKKKMQELYDMVDESRKVNRHSDTYYRNKIKEI